MLKINLNELKQFKAIALYSEGYDYIYNEEDYIPDIYYFCGFIEHIYARDGKIVFKVYGVGFADSGKLRHTEFEINMQEIDVYEKKIEADYGIYDEYTSYEYMNINTSYESNLINSRYTSNSQFKLFKNLNFRFLMRRFGELLPPDKICEIESAMLMDESILRLVNIPEDYKFAKYY